MRKSCVLNPSEQNRRTALIRNNLFVVSHSVKSRQNVKQATRAITKLSKQRKLLPENKHYKFNVYIEWNRHIYSSMVVFPSVSEAEAKTKQNHYKWK